MGESATIKSIHYTISEWYSWMELPSETGWNREASLTLLAKMIGEELSAYYPEANVVVDRVKGGSDTDVIRLTSDTHDGQEPDHDRAVPPCVRDECAGDGDHDDGPRCSCANCPVCYPGDDYERVEGIANRVWASRPWLVALSAEEVGR